MQHWGWGEHMSKQESVPNDLNPMLLFFSDEESRVPLVIFAVAMLLVTSRVFYSLNIKDSDVHDEVRFLSLIHISEPTRR